MDREARLTQLGAALQAACAAGDWTRLGEHVGALDGQLRQLAARGPWSVGERAALLRLRQEHERAAQRVASAAAALDTRLHRMRSNEEGWLAYALQDATHGPEHADTEREYGASQGQP